MAFFKSFQNNLPSVNISSILDSVSSRVDDLANAVSDVTYAVSDQLTEQVTTIINKVQDEEDGEHIGSQESGYTAATQEVKNMWQKSGSAAGESTEVDHTPSQLEWEWRDGCWRVKKTEAELVEEERRKKEKMELQEKREQRRKERWQKQLEKKAMLPKTKEEPYEAQPENPGGEDGQEREMTNEGGQRACREPSHLPEVESDCLSKEKIKNEEEEEEEVKDKHPGRRSDEVEISKAKKKKSEKKKEKGGEKASKKSEDSFDVEKRKGEGKKKNKKKKHNRG